MQVTIVLTTGGFFPREDTPQNHVDVGYFETPHASDIEVLKDNKKLKPRQNCKLGKAKKRGKAKTAGKDDVRIIDVQHMKKDGVTVKENVKRSRSFIRDILKKDDLYELAESPDFNPQAYDCILRFHSGHFKSHDVRPRRFTEHWCSNGKPTKNEKWTRKIANEIHVEYDIHDGEVLRLRNPDDTDLWSSASIASGTKGVLLKILTDDSLNPKYHKKALTHKCQHYYLPNSDPPPMNGNSGGLTP